VQVTPFTIEIPQDRLDDLHARLDRTRLPDEVNDAEWGWGTDLGYLRRALRYWREEYDWRFHEARLNAFPQYVADVDGGSIHFLHARGRGPRVVPLLLSHGWPGSFVEMLDLLPLLTGPSDLTDAAGVTFDVVVPSLPGFGFSERPRAPGTSSAVVAQRFHALMTGLGYPRYAVQGGDLGAGISLRLARARPESVIGAHVNFPYFVYDGPGESADHPGPLSDLARQRWLRAEGGYSHLHSTRPQTLGVALTDSPAGLAAWILEKFFAWSDRSATDGEMPFHLDELLTNLSVYWFTETITSSMRIYREGAADPLVLSPTDPIEVPVGVASFPHEIGITQPRERVAAVANLTRWSDMSAGGHFAALEQPRLLAGEIAAFVSGLS
jgi:pimeloyl-ACP methyl ester carboxylesterase